MLTRPITTADPFISSFGQSMPIPVRLLATFKDPIIRTLGHLQAAAKEMFMPRLSRFDHCSRVFAAGLAVATRCASAGWVCILIQRPRSGWLESSRGRQRALESRGWRHRLRCQAARRSSDKNLWTEKEYGDFMLRIDWRLKSAPFQYKGSIILPDGSEKLGRNG